MRILSSLVLLLYGFCCLGTNKTVTDEEIEVTVQKIMMEFSFKCKVKLSDPISVLFPEIRKLYQTQENIKLIYNGELLTKDQNEKATFAEKGIKNGETIFFSFFSPGTSSVVWVPPTEPGKKIKNDEILSTTTNVPSGSNEKPQSLIGRHGTDEKKKWWCPC
jgi:hypothetical protein